MAGASERKAELRAHLRHVRRQVDDPATRSARIWEVVRGLDEVAGAGVVMAFASIRGEPDTAAFVDWCTAVGKTVVLPEDEPDPALPDVVVVPAVAFSRDGHRLGQGGGWYDRFLARVRPDCRTVGVAFREQLVDELPLEPHDVALDRVVTDAGIAR